MDMYEWLIWSNEHGGWWKADEQGYTTDRRDAGRYSYRKACEIVYKANEHQFLMERKPNEAMIRIESQCCHAPLIDGVQCESCGADDRSMFPEKCEMCGGLGYLTTPAEVRGGDIIGPDDRPCPACQGKDEDDYDDQS